MAARCAVCGLVFERETGYFIGAIYINYGLTVGLALVGYFLLDAWLAPSPGWQAACGGPSPSCFRSGPSVTARRSGWRSTTWWIRRAASRGEVARCDAE